MSSVSHRGFTHLGMDDLGCAGKHNAFGGLVRGTVALRHSKLHTVVLEDHSTVLRLLSRNDTTTSSPIAPASSIAWTRCCVSWSLVASHASYQPLRGG